MALGDRTPRNGAGSCSGSERDDGRFGLGNGNGEGGFRGRTLRLGKVPLALDYTYLMCTNLAARHISLSVLLREKLSQCPTAESVGPWTLVRP